jgi:hypothetical protein
MIRKAVKLIVNLDFFTHSYTRVSEAQRYFSKRHLPVYAHVNAHLSGDKGEANEQSIRLIRIHKEKITGIPVSLKRVNIRVN